MVPTTEVLVLRSAHTTCTRRFRTGATSATAGAEARIALASSHTSVEADPAPWEAALPVVATPLWTNSRFEPRDLSWLSAWVWAPRPTVTIVITAAMPMITPSIVKIERRRLATSDCKARGTVSRKSASRGAWPSSRTPRRSPGKPPRRSRPQPRRSTASPPRLAPGPPDRRPDTGRPGRWPARRRLIECRGRHRRVGTGSRF